ncbi:hypothetical protein ILYODFUR_014840 [Ilyodon furcidens]|uniref:Uncharacterized protein n=1 Tax=Ilyodon furcidens TaxID=33524 RepID=A0ABV0SX24_9TELE
MPFSRHQIPCLTDYITVLLPRRAWIKAHARCCTPKRATVAGLAHRTPNAAHPEGKKRILSACPLDRTATHFSAPASRLQETCMSDALMRARGDGTTQTHDPSPSLYFPPSH